MTRMMRWNERGMTLLELLIAMMLLATALVGLGASFPLAMIGVNVGGFQTTATLLAQQSIEIAKDTPYALLPTLDTGGFIIVPAYGAGFTRQVTVLPANPNPNTTTVTAVVRFTGGAGGINDTTIATIISQ